MRRCDHQLSDTFGTNALRESFRGAQFLLMNLAGLRQFLPIFIIILLELFSSAPLSAQAVPAIQAQAAIDSLRSFVEQDRLQRVEPLVAAYGDLAPRISDPLRHADYTFWIARGREATQDYSGAIELLLELLPYYHRVDSTDRLATIYSRTARMYAVTGRTDLSNTNYETALALAEQTGNPTARARDLHNYALNFMDADPSRCRALLEAALTINVAQHNERYLAANYGSLAQLELEADRLTAAVSLYRISVRYAEAAGNRDALYTTYYHLGVLNTQLGAYDEARRYLTAADSFARRNGLRDLRISLQHGFYQLAERQGDYRAALRHFADYVTGTDSLRTLHDTERIGELLARQEQELAVRQKALEVRDLRRTLLAGLLVSLLLLAGGWVLLKNQRLQTQLSQLRNTELRADLQQRERELTSFLFDRLQAGAEREAAVAYVREQKKRATARHFPLFEAIAQRLERGAGPELWAEFDARFGRVHPDFLQRLRIAHPELTAAELKTCALLSLQLSSKEIMALTGQTLRAVEQQRTRIRRKCGLTNTGDPLPGYLLSMLAG